KRIITYSDNLEKQRKSINEVLKMLEYMKMGHNPGETLYNRIVRSAELIAEIESRYLKNGVIHQSEELQQITLNAAIAADRVMYSNEPLTESEYKEWIEYSNIIINTMYIEPGRIRSTVLW